MSLGLRATRNEQPTNTSTYCHNELNSTMALLEHQTLTDHVRGLFAVGTAAFTRCMTALEQQLRWFTRRLLEKPCLMLLSSAVSSRRYFFQRFCCVLVHWNRIPVPSVHSVSIQHRLWNQVAFLFPPSRALVHRDLETGAKVEGVGR